MMERQLTYRFIETLCHAEYGSITVTTPDGKTHHLQGRQPGPIADITLHHWGAVRQFVQNGDIGLAQAYRDGGWDSQNLSELFQFGLLNEAALEKYIYGSFLARIATRISYLFTRNSLKGSQKNIHAHYDLGNDFYSLWLDPTMTYSSAIFHHAGEDLKHAQYNKYDRITERLGTSGNLLEIGCGWGGFAERALENGDFTIKGLTISKAQHEYATRRLGNTATIALEDYRIQHGKFDHIVSIEMFEAVGERYWPVYFSKMQSLLARKGKAVVQTITIKDDHFRRYREGGDAIRTFIFPGGMLPSPERFESETNKAGLRVTDRFAFGQDYARTLEHWLKKFEKRLPEIMALGFDQRFIRLWRFYLTCCIASFKVGRTDVMQWELQHAA